VESELDRKRNISFSPLLIMNTNEKRLNILSKDEIEAMYGRPGLRQ
jgi:hypothetical protein